MIYTCIIKTRKEVQKIKKRKLFNTLAKKYELPIKYIYFKLNPYYIYNADYEMDIDSCQFFESKFDWEYIKEDFERDRNTYSSVFYGM